MSPRFDIAVVGGGAAGLAAAIAAAREGKATAIVDRMPRLGKKILVTGGGRCNLGRERLEAGLFSSTDPSLVASVFERFGTREITRFFEQLGLRIVSDGGRLYPATNQAASVLKVLELEVRRQRIEVFTGFEAAAIEPAGRTFVLPSVDGRKIEARAVILAGGGRSYPALGADGSAFALARALGHRLIEPVPSCVPLLVRDRMCHFLQGQKIRAGAEAWVEGRAVSRADGDLLFTAYGLSGTAVLDVSTEISVALNRDKKRRVEIRLDLVPAMGRDELNMEILRRLNDGWAEADLVSGLLPEKFGKTVAGWIPPGSRTEERIAAALAEALKNQRLQVQGTRGWNEAEFTSGGLDAGEIESERLESKIIPRLFLAGEICDVQGPRGGFNLSWAWASGTLAGRGAASGFA
ncbi:MAG: aminoacetone oxidase family FAD-binding enzyme [Candidatus Aminicenantes bacterium]|nr:aminoacetone oxidase family FAD-binding enzyme [Candidatus Aminicenantes bacterium]